MHAWGQYNKNMILKIKIIIILEIEAFTFLRNFMRNIYQEGEVMHEPFNL